MGKRWVASVDDTKISRYTSLARKLFLDSFNPGSPGCYIRTTADTKKKVMFGAQTFLYKAAVSLVVV